MAFGDGFLDELRARLRVSEIVGRRVKLTRKGREHSGLCPFHNEKTPSFTVNDEKGFYHCFGCGAHGSAIDFVMETEGLAFPEAVERLAAEAGLEVPRRNAADQAREAKRKTLYDVMELASRWFQAQLDSVAGREAQAYVERRGLKPETVRTFRLGYAPDNGQALIAALEAREITLEQMDEVGLVARPEDGGKPYARFRHRLMFPIADRRGRVVAFGGRALGEQRAKYLNSPETPLFHKGRMLFNQAGARQAAHERGRVVVAEGYMDVIALAEQGFPESVAPLGTALTEEQMQELWRLCPEPVLCFDGDAAGQRAAFRAAERALPGLRPGHSLRFIELPAGEDPDTLVRSQGPSAFRDLLNAARPLSDVVWRLETEGRAFDTPERRAGLRQALKSRLQQIGDPVVRDYYGQDFKQRLDSFFAPPRRSGGGTRPMRAGGMAPGRGRGGGGGRFGPAPNERRLRPAEGLQDDGRMREKFLVAALLCHPELAERLLDELSSLRIRQPALDRILSAILNHAGSGRPLDLTLLKDEIKNETAAGLVQELMSPGFRRPYPALHASSELDVVEQAWRQAFLLHRRPELQAELTRSVAEPDGESWAAQRRRIAATRHVNRHAATSDQPDD